MTVNPTNILAISGSLRQSSTNSAALRAAAAAAAQGGIVVTIDASIRTLPQFDPDLESAPPDTVLRFREACKLADGVLLAVPEYAFGIPGAFKNALDWTVGTSALYRKPVTVLSVAPPSRGTRVREALAHVLTAIGADAIFAPCRSRTPIATPAARSGTRRSSPSCARSRPSSRPVRTPRPPLTRPGRLRH